MNLEDFDAFILDLDGTLIDSGKYHVRAFADAVAELGEYRLTPNERLEFFASHSKPFARVLNARHGLRLVPDQVLERKRVRMKEIFRIDLFEGARDFLEKWRGSKPMGLATNSPSGFVFPILEEAELAGFFDAVTTSDEVTHRKPHPEIVETTLRKLGAVPRKTLVFEDQLMGITAALDAGAQVVAVDNGQRVVFPETVPVMNWKELLKQ